MMLLLDRLTNLPLLLPRLLVKTSFSLLRLLELLAPLLMARFVLEIMLREETPVRR
ncbi:hypothetical protein O998_05015 [Anaplasma phagocytophilum str. Norway variant1]|uniref:Uncharacterized protein n=1 Tax=Anaplasma phagocytophilum str. Norway variant1 TaxID=1392506 RepID=A0A7H9DZQ5_ANAPH|nr:hypothetical protein O998_05015 [Anaplasma phagocytophilum str. Norway variant1]